MRWIRLCHVFNHFRRGRVMETHAHKTRPEHLLSGALSCLAIRVRVRIRVREPYLGALSVKSSDRPLTPNPNPNPNPNPKPCRSAVVLSQILDQFPRITEKFLRRLDSLCGLQILADFLIVCPAFNSRYQDIKISRYQDPWSRF